MLPLISEADLRLDMSASLQVDYLRNHPQCDQLILVWSVLLFVSCFLHSSPLSWSAPHSLFQLQLFYSSPRVWAAAPDSSRVRVAQDVTAEPASAEQWRSLWQREPGWLLPQHHQHQERNTVRNQKTNKTTSPSLSRESGRCLITRQTDVSLSLPSLPGRYGAGSSIPAPTHCRCPSVKLPRQWKPSPSQLSVPLLTEAAATFMKAALCPVTPFTAPPWTSPVAEDALSPPEQPPRLLCSWMDIGVRNSVMCFLPVVFCNNHLNSTKKYKWAIETLNQFV